MVLPDPRIAIVDYGAGNIQSILNAVNTIGLKNTFLTSSPAEIQKADGIVLPGVGAFAHCMRNLIDSGLIPTLERAIVQKGRPLLGICVGMQLLAESSEEGGLHSGLGWVPGKIKMLESSILAKVPHVGWNQVKINSTSGLFSRIQEQSNFYFDHSYSFVGSSTVISSSTYHGQEIAASIQMANVHGVQFHPEKSDRNGLRIFRAFGNMVAEC